MGQSRLTSFMLLNIEKDLVNEIDHETIIESFADTPTLQKQLMK